MAIFRYTRSTSRDNRRRHRSLFSSSSAGQPPFACCRLPPAALAHHSGASQEANKIDRAGAEQLKVLGKSDGAELQWRIVDGRLAGKHDWHCVVPSSTDVALVLALAISTLSKRVIHLSSSPPSLHLPRSEAHLRKEPNTDSTAWQL